MSKGNWMAGVVLSGACLAALGGYWYVQHSQESTRKAQVVEQPPEAKHAPGLPQQAASVSAGGGLASQGLAVSELQAAAPAQIPASEDSAAPAGAATGASANAAFDSVADAPASQPALPANTPVFVLNSLSGNVSVIDPTNWQEISRVPTGKEPHHLYLTPDEKSVIVANAASDSLTFMDPRTGEVQRTIRNILDPYHLRFSPDMKWFVTAANRLNHMDIYRWENNEPVLVKRIPTGKTPSHLWIDSASRWVWASMQDSNELVVIDLATQTLTHRVSTGPMPADVFVTPDDRTLLVGLTGSDRVQVFDVEGGKQPELKGEIVTGKGAHAFRSAGDGRHVYVSNRVANTISKVDHQTLQVVASFHAPSGPDCMEVLADGKTILVASRWAGKLSVIDTESQRLITQVPVGRSPHGVWTLNHVGRL